MGKRKKSAASKAGPKKQLKLDTVFDCPFCNNFQSVESTISRKPDEMFAELECLMCRAQYSMRITHLTEAVDVYAEWLDECERANTDI